jgi:hypothetical protein
MESVEMVIQLLEALAQTHPQTLATVVMAEVAPLEAAALVVQES